MKRTPVALLVVTSVPLAERYATGGANRTCVGCASVGCIASSNLRARSHVCFQRLFASCVTQKMPNDDMDSIIAVPVRIHANKARLVVDIRYSRDSAAVAARKKR